MGRIRTWPSRRILDRRDAATLLGLLVLAVVLPTVIGAVSGSLDIPRNDDWSYRRAALHLFETGRIELDGWAAMALVGQLIVVQPFLWLSHGQPWAFTVLGILVAGTAVVAGYLVVRRVVPGRRALLAIVLLPLFPGYLPYATSFMTDVPALAAEFVCLGLGMVALRQRPIRLGWLIASLSVGFVGFTIREFALAAPASVLVLALVVEPRRIALWLSLGALAAGGLAFAAWRGTLPGQLDTSLRAPLSAFELNKVARAASSAAFVLLAAAVVSWPRCLRRLRPSDVALGVVVGFILIAGAVVQRITAGIMPPILLDNLISRYGAAGPLLLTGGRPVLIPDLLWAALNALALVATFLVLGTVTGMIGAILRRDGLRGAFVSARSGSPAWLLVIFAGTTVLGLTVVGLTASMFDRYLWVLIPPLAALILAFGADVPEPGERVGFERSVLQRLRVLPALATRRATMALACVLMVVLGTLSLAFLLNSDAYDAAKWRAGQALERDAIPAGSIDAGLEWVGYHAVTRAEFSRVDFTKPLPSPIWYEHLWPSFHACGIVSQVPLAAGELHLVRSETDAYRLLLFAGPPEPLYLYRREGSGCP